MKKAKNLANAGSPRELPSSSGRRRSNKNIKGKNISRPAITQREKERAQGAEDLLFRGEEAAASGAKPGRGWSHGNANYKRRSTEKNWW